MLHSHQVRASWQSRFLRWKPAFARKKRKTSFRNLKPPSLIFARSGQISQVGFWKQSPSVTHPPFIHIVVSCVSYLCTNIHFATSPSLRNHTGIDGNLSQTPPTPFFEEHRTHPFSETGVRGSIFLAHIHEISKKLEQPKNPNATCLQHFSTTIFSKTLSTHFSLRLLHNNSLYISLQHSSQHFS